LSGSSDTFATVTNASGQTFTVNFSPGWGHCWPDPPPFAWSVIGPLTQSTNSHAGYQVTVTRFSDIVTNAPPAVTTSVSASGNNRILTWPAVPYNYSYSVLSSTNVAGPYAPESTFQATMLGVNEVPANGSTAVGFGTVALSPDQSTITVNMSFSGLSAPRMPLISTAGRRWHLCRCALRLQWCAGSTSGIPEQSFAINAPQTILKTASIHERPQCELPQRRDSRATLPEVLVGRTFTTGSGIY
jgi:hypothetical protein